MFFSTPKADDSDLRRLLDQNPELETLFVSLSQMFQGNKPQLCDFLFFAFSNELYPAPQLPALKAVFLRAAAELGLNRYLHLFWVFEQEQPGPGGLSLLFLLLRTARFAELFKLKLEDVGPALAAALPSPMTAADLAAQLRAELGALPLTGPEPAVLGVLLGSPGPDDPEALVQQLRAVSAASELALGLDFPLPLPFEVPVEEEEPMTPFPFILEAPLLNPCLKYGQLLKDLLGSLSKLSEDELSVG